MSTHTHPLMQGKMPLFLLKRILSLEKAPIGGLAAMKWLF